MGLEHNKKISAQRISSGYTKEQINRELDRFLQRCTPEIERNFIDSIMTVPEVAEHYGVHRNVIRIIIKRIEERSGSPVGFMIGGRRAISRAELPSLAPQTVGKKPKFKNA